MGRAMERVIAVARECGYLDGVPPFLGPDPFDRLPRDKVLALATGSQGEPRAALARIAEDEHPSAQPGRRRHRRLFLAHHSGQRKGGRQDHQRPRHAGRRGRHRPHASRACLGPSAPRRTREDVRLAQAQNRDSRAWRAGASFRARRLRQGAGRARGRARVQRRRRQARRGRRGRDRADRPRPADTRTAKFCCRRATNASSSAASSPSRASSRSRSRSRRRAKCRGDPDVMIAGLPQRTREGAAIDALIDAAIFETFESLPRGKRRDADFVSGAIERARPQRRQCRLGQEADGACAGGGSVGERASSEWRMANSKTLFATALLAIRHSR